MPNPNWVPGHKTTSGHRPLGSRNRRTQQLEELLDKRGDRHPVEFLSQITSDGTIDLETRIQAAAIVAPYRCSKMGATPPLRYIEEPVVFPHPLPITVDHVNANVAHLNQLYAAGTLDLDSYNLMLAGQREHTVTFKAREDLPSDQDIHITGGLPALPGTNITMPQLNGHKTLGLLPPNDPPITPPQDVDQPPVISAEEPPHGS